MFKHTIQGYRGTTTVTVPPSPDSVYKIKYTMELDKLECYNVRNLIPAYCKKELSEYSQKVPHLIRHECDEKHYTLSINSLDGLKDINEIILPFLREMDIFLHYYLMDIPSLGAHFKIIQDAIREQHQSHWLKENPAHENSILSK